MLRRICSSLRITNFINKERKKNTELRKLLELKPVSLEIKKNRLQWFGHC